VLDDDLVDEGHAIWVDVVVVVSIVEAVRSLARANNFTLLGFPHPPPTGSFFVSGSGCALLPRVLTADLLQSAEDGIGHLARSGRAIQIWGPDLRLAKHLIDGPDHARSGVLVPEVI
jgi:hypothetical protein